MSGFRVTLSLSEKELGPVLARFSKKQLDQISIEPMKNGDATVEGLAAPAWVGVVGPNTILMRTDKDGKPDGIYGRALTDHEKLEAKHGIGQVTRRMVTAKVKKYRANASHVLTHLINEDWLMPVGADDA